MFTMRSTLHLVYFAFALGLAAIVSSGNVPDVSCGNLLVKYTQMSDEVEKLPAMIQHLMDFFQSAKKRMDDAQAELDIRQTKYQACKVLEPDEQGWVPPDVCRLSLEPEMKGYQVIIDDNEKLISNVKPSIQAAEVHQAELLRDISQLQSQLIADGCPLDFKMSPARHTLIEKKTEI
jgi:hypothetical protein